MKYRVQIDVSFNGEQDAVDFLNKVENVKTKAYKPSGTEKILCYRTTRYHECSHDDIIPVQCGGYINVDFDEPKKTHETKGGI